MAARRRQTIRTVILKNYTTTQFRTLIFSVVPFPESARLMTGVIDCCQVQLLGSIAR